MTPDTREIAFCDLTPAERREVAQTEAPELDEELDE